MGLLRGSGRTRVPGYKELTLDLPLETINDPRVIGKIYIPKLAPSGKEISFSVEIGSVVKRGQRIGLAPGFYMPVFAPVSGKISGQENIYNSLLGRPIPHFVLENDFKDEWAEPLKILDLETSSRTDIVNAIKEAGINGLGGAGFPTYVKYEKEQPIDCLIINAVECEPYLTPDYHNIKLHPDKFVAGVRFLKKACQAKEAVIAIKVTHPDLIAFVNEKIKDIAGLRVFPVRDLYPMGWEKALVQAILHRDYEGLPAEAGAIINNASTAIAVADALLDGRPITRRVISVSGDAVKPAVVEVPIYTQVKQLIEYLGGYTADVVNLIAGGPLSSKALLNDNFVVEKTTGSLLVLKHRDYPAEACLRCGRCVLACPASLYPVAIKDALDRKDFARLRALQVNKCVECGICSYVCPSKIDLLGSLRKAKLFLRLEDAKLARKPLKKPEATR